MEKPKRYAVIGDDGETCVFIRDAWIQKGNLARAVKLVKNGNGITLAHFHDTGRTWTVHQLLDWADEVVIVREMAAAEATYESVLTAYGMQTSVHQFAEKSEPLPVGGKNNEPSQDDTFGPSPVRGAEGQPEHDLTPELGDPRYYGKLPESGEPPPRTGGIVDGPIGCD